MSCAVLCCLVISCAGRPVFAVLATFAVLAVLCYPSTGVTSFYSSQLRPLCEMGHQPTPYTYPDTDIELLTCSPCPVGTYKMDHGGDDCTECEEGMGE